jgi:radical SAM superfamily enzyme YgiQ (UPF0313 family)
MHTSPTYRGKRPVAIREAGGVLLISCYELGQQPLGLVVPAAHLERAGFAPALMDISVEPLNTVKVQRATLVGISVPMHTALRLGIGVAKRVRAVNSHCTIVFYGIYAALNADHLLDHHADACLGAEFEHSLVDLAAALDRGSDGHSPTRVPNPQDELALAKRDKGGVPSRQGLPPIDRYVKFAAADGVHNVGAVTTTRGCKHSCRHCPIPSVYGGRFYAMDVKAVLEDVRQLVATGVKHITFADADFLNGRRHALRVVNLVHSEFPWLTFDFTAKIEHLAKYPDVIRELHSCGCAFVVSAVESLSNRTLAALDKGHTRDDALAVIRFFRRIGLTLRPSLVPFTPWDTLDDYIDLLETVENEGLIDHIDPVQYGIRLLVPPGSLLLHADAMQPYLGPLDAGKLTYEWRHPDPSMDHLQGQVASAVEDAAASNEDHALTFFRVRRLAHSSRGDNAHGDPSWSEIARRYPANRTKPPRLTEDWFC